MFHRTGRPYKLVMVGVNKKRFWPTVEAIKARYYLKYRGGTSEE